MEQTHKRKKLQTNIKINLYVDMVTKDYMKYY